MARRLVAGVTGGLAGGIVFGFLMARMGMFPMVASIVRSDSAGVGLVIHLMISVTAGLCLTVLFADKFLSSYGRAAVAGVIYGALWWVIWWVVGALRLAPLFRDLPVFPLELMVAMTLLGHLIYGVTLGLTAVRVLKGRT